MTTNLDYVGRPDKDAMTATLPDKRHENARNWSGKKELVSTYTVAALGADRDGKARIEFPIDCRCWMGRSRDASVVHASIWIHGKDLWLSGRGTAGGYGYHKESAAIDDAIHSAGIKLSKSIHGVGDSAIKDALAAIARALGYSLFGISTH